MGRLLLGRPFFYHLKCPVCDASWTAELSEETRISGCFLCGETLSIPFGDLLDTVRRLSAECSKIADFSVALRDSLPEDEALEPKSSISVELRCSKCGAVLEFPLKKVAQLERTIHARGEFRCPNCRKRWNDDLSKILILLSDFRAGTEEKRKLGGLRLSNQPMDKIFEQP